MGVKHIDIIRLHLDFPEIFYILTLTVHSDKLKETILK